MSWTPLRKPLSKSRMALVTSAGFSIAGQAPFNGSVKRKDPSFRDIPSDVDVRTLVENHRSELFDHAGIARDLNLAFPVERVREMAERGRIGSVAPRYLSFMGSITAPGRLALESAPRAAQLLVEDSVDVALLVPV